MIDSPPSPPSLLPQLPFLSPEEASEAAQELALLRKTGERGLNWIAQRIATAVERDPRRPDAAEILFRVLESARVGQWGDRPDWELPHPGLRAAHRLLSTRYRTSKWFREFRDAPGYGLPRLQ
ncbi:MAG: hypothetical protein AAB225_17530 [Acidobacteriota bacterium]